MGNTNSLVVAWREPPPKRGGEWDDLVAELNERRGSWAQCLVGIETSQRAKDRARSLRDAARRADVALQTRIAREGSTWSVYARVRIPDAAA